MISKVYLRSPVCEKLLKYLLRVMYVKQCKSVLAHGVISKSDTLKPADNLRQRILENTHLNSEYQQ